MSVHPSTMFMRIDRPRNLAITLSTCVAILCEVSGCHRSDAPLPPGAGRSERAALAPSETDNSNANADVAQFIGSAASLPPDDPSAQGWETEVIAARAGKQLKSLVRGMLVNESPQAAQLKNLVTDDFRCSALRPKSLDEIFRGQALVVRRLPDSPTSQSGGEQDYRGEQGLAKALGDLSGAIGERRDAHEKFKIFRVHAPSLTEAVTDTYFQLGANTNTGTYQIHATWRCTWQTGSKLRLRSIDVLGYEETVGSSDGPMFTDCTESVIDGPAFRDQLVHGIDHWLSSVETRHGIDIGGWQGIAVGDVNGDDLDDLYVCQPGGLPNRLFVQHQDGTCREISATAGVDFLDSTHGSLLVDLDNDGDQDLLISMSDGVMIMSNNGSGRFTPRAPCITPSGSPYSLAASDYDNDGDLDVFVCCYNPRKGVVRHLLFARPVPYHDADNGARNVLLRNDATPSRSPWRFRYVTLAAGLVENNTRFSYAAAWEDFDEDGDQDLYVANDFGRNNLYRNDGGRFTDVAPAAHAEDISPGMSACWGDYNNDGRMDLYISNMFSSAGNRITFQDRFMGQAEAATRSDFQRHARGNSLLRNNGDGTFEDVSETSAVTLGRWAWGSKFVDVNNDGFQDLLVANGFITQQDTGDL